MWACWDPHFFVFASSHLLLKSKMGNFLLGALGYCPFHHYIHYWCDFTSYFDLSWSSFLFICSLFRHHPRHCFWFIHFASPPCHFLTLIYSKFDTFFALFLCISLSVRFSLLPHYFFIKIFITRLVIEPEKLPVYGSLVEPAVERRLNRWCNKYIIYNYIKFKIIIKNKNNYKKIKIIVKNWKDIKLQISVMFDFHIWYIKLNDKV